MSADIAKEELHVPKPLIYKITPTQMGDAMRRGINRRTTRVFRDAQITRTRARNAAKRLKRGLLKGEIDADPSIIGVCRHLQTMGETRVVGKGWRKPRDGRRL